jgi:plastocyanin
MAHCHEHQGGLAAFTTRMPKRGSPRTPGFVTTAEFERLKRRGEIQKTAHLRRMTRKFINDKIIMPDGREIEFWGFETGNGGREFLDAQGRGGVPSPTIRVNQGDIVQLTLKPGKRVHTIHLHGIEPDDFNDGVGHTSFEVTGGYTYQFRPSHAGTYFYHCHVNTVLHVQMGMFGLLVVDPPSGKGKLFPHGPRYDKEAILVPFELDPRWHTLGHAAGLDGADVGLHNFRPQYFLVNGAAAPNPSDISKPQVINDPRVTIRGRVGQRILIRHLNGGYFPSSLLMPEQLLPGYVYEHDARPYLKINPRTGRVVRRRGRLVHPRQPIPAAGLVGLTVAERQSMIVQPRVAGRFLITIFFQHWISGRRWRADVPVIIKP